MEALSVFPLHRVVVPGEAIVLHVFEERFMTMLDELADDRFGIVLIKTGEEVGLGAEYHDVGTVARIAKSRTIEDGRRLLAMVGEQRFAIVDRLDDNVYPAATVDLLDEGTSDDSGELLAATGRALRRYLVVSAESGFGADIHFELSSNAVEASYQVASLLRVSSPERQALLELPTVRERLEREERILGRETVLMERVMGAN